VLRYVIVAWLFCPLLGADSGVLVSLGRSIGTSDVFLGVAGLLFAAPIVAVQGRFSISPCP
jgi:hypothetical protein